MLDLTNTLQQMNAHSIASVFRPVRCTERQLEGHKAVDGFVYFTTDTKKIYCGINNEFTPMGGNSGIYYGDRYFTEDETGTEQTDFTFTSSEIQGNQMPQVDDLILNVPTGEFFRVIYTDIDQLIGRRLTVAGSGGGGPSGGGGSSAPVIVDNYRGTRYFSTSAKPEELRIYFQVTSSIAENNYIASIKYTFGTEVIEDFETKDFGTDIYFDVYKYLNKLNTSGTNTLKIQAFDAFGNASIKKDIRFNIVELSLASRFPAIHKVSANAEKALLEYYCTPQGGDTIDELYIEIKIAPINDRNAVIYEHRENVFDTSRNYTIPIDLKQINNISHGVYYLTARFCGYIAETKKTEVSNTLDAQIIYYDNDVNSILIATNFIGATIAQYDRYEMQYMVATNSTLTEDTVQIYIGSEPSAELATLNAINTWTHTFIEKGIFEISILYGNNHSILGDMNVVEYEGSVPIINTSNPSLELYLTALGKTNTQVSRDEWSWHDKRKDKIYETEFENFLWGSENGWIIDQKGETSLHLTNGAKISLPDYHPFGEDGTVTGLTIELDFKLSGVLDYSKPLISCLSRTSEGAIQTGFLITGQKATLNSSKIKATAGFQDEDEDSEGNVNEVNIGVQSFTQYFNEDTRIHLTYVVEQIPSTFTDEEFFFVYTYLNGVISGISKLSTSAVNKTHETFLDARTNASFIEIDSTYGDIDIYNMRVYRTALDKKTVINNYIADMYDLDTKIAMYNDNNIFTKDGEINLSAIQSLSYKMNVPYVLFKGGNKIQEELDESIIYDTSSTIEYRLPYAKDDFRLMSVAMYNNHISMDTPVWQVGMEMIDNNDNKITDFKNIQKNVAYKPTRGVQVYGQGTSSMVYPVKNLRLKTIQEDDFPMLYENSCPLEIVCFKADFMDSSSSHNTGTGNLVYDLYAGLNMKSPPQQFALDHKGKDGVLTHDILTAIKGYPIICFFQEGDDKNDKWTFIGRYNFNIDKATPEPFGFVPQCYKTGRKTSDNREEVVALGLKTEEIEGMKVLPLDNEGKEIKQDIIQCWEILNNDSGSPTKFLRLNDNSLPRDFGLQLTQVTGQGKKGPSYLWANYYEDRYPDKLAGIGKGKKENNRPTYTEDLENGIFRVAKWVNSTALGSEVTNTRLPEGKYYQTLDTVWNESKNYYTSDHQPIEIIKSTFTSIESTGFIDEEFILKDVSIDSDIFDAKAKSLSLDFGTYSFIYDNSWDLTKDGEVLYENVNLQEYGINYSNNMSPVDGNTLIVTYVETNNWRPDLYEFYEIDNENYRLSKFKTEFTQYFDMEFSTFYYILTLVLLMMDSRAKNMMLASWDQTIWYPIFYDMDTMLGVNNTGFNKFSYDVEDDPNDKVFNGWDSVLWNNFRTCFPTQIADFYARMRAANFTIEKLANIFNTNGADSWNEAIITNDAIYKYERTFRDGYWAVIDGTLQFVERGQGKNYFYAAQGKRSNHRAWWLQNRLNYFDSKYMPLTYGSMKPSSESTFSFRAYALPEQKSTDKAQACVAVVPTNHNFDITALTNSYQSTFVGNITYGPTYTLAGQTVTLGPGSQVKHEVESWILNPTLIADLGDLSDKYLGEFGFPQNLKTRLTRLKFGRSSRSDPDTYQAYYNALISSLSIGSSCPYLNELNVAKCTSLGELDLQKCTRLQVLDAEGCTSLTTVDFPANSILEEVYLPANMTSLALTNQPYLHTLVLEKPSSITELTLDRITGIDTYDLVKDAMSAGTTAFYLTDINWVIDDTQAGAIKNEDDGITYLESIDILEQMAESLTNNQSAVYPKTGYTLAQALTGTITIAVPDITANEYDLYEKYKSIFPNVTIKYDENVTNVQRSPTLYFMSGDETTVHYKVLSDGNSTIELLISAAGPNGIAMVEPTKAPTASTAYTFNHFWKEKDSGRYYYENKYYSSWSEANSKFREIFGNGVSLTGTLETQKPNQNTASGAEDLYTFYYIPQFNAAKRTYPITFYDGMTKIDTIEVEYDTVYNGYIKNYWYKDSSGFADVAKRWAFKGWSTSNYGTNEVNNPNYIDLENYVVKSPITLYAHYVEEDCRKNESKLEYFIRSGDTISIHPNYRDILEGKITIPTSCYDENGILGTPTKLGDFKSLTKVTHIFFLEDNLEYTTILKNAFERTSSLTYIELPVNIQNIGAYAFQMNNNLEYCSMPEGVISIDTGAFARCEKLVLTKLPSSLKIIAMAAFQSASKITISEIPKSVTQIGNSAFSYCYNITVSKLGGTESSLESIGESAFLNAGSNVISLGIGASVAVIEKDAFKGFGNNKLTSVSFAKNSVSEYYRDADKLYFHENVSLMGFKTDGSINFEYNISI